MTCDLVLIDTCFVGHEVSPLIGVSLSEPHIVVSSFEAVWTCTYVCPHYVMFCARGPCVCVVIVWVRKELSMCESDIHSHGTERREATERSGENVREESGRDPLRKGREASGHVRTSTLSLDPFSSRSRAQNSHAHAHCSLLQITHSLSQHRSGSPPLCSAYH